MTKYAKKPVLSDKAAHACRRDTPAHFKNTHEAGNAIRGRTIENAKRYLNDVLAHKRCIPIRKHKSHVGRTGQATEFGVTQGRWFDKSVRFLLELIKNLEANAKAKQLDIKKLVLTHVQVNRAPKGRRRTFRAHGRVTPYLSSPCHIEMFAEEPLTNVQKPEQKPNKRITARADARSRVRRFLKIGGDKK